MEVDKGYRGWTHFVVYPNTNVGSGLLKRATKVFVCQEMSCATVGSNHSRS